MSKCKEQYLTQQVSGGLRIPIPKPERSEPLKTFLADRTLADRRRDEYVDRAVGTLSDGYTHDELVDVVRHCWQGWEADLEAASGSDGGSRKRK
jgi:hypothetical protein